METPPPSPPKKETAPPKKETHPPAKKETPPPSPPKKETASPKKETVTPPPKKEPPPPAPKETAPPPKKEIPPKKEEVIVTEEPVEETPSYKPKLDRIFASGFPTFVEYENNKPNPKKVHKKRNPKLVATPSLLLAEEVIKPKGESHTVTSTFKNITATATMEPLFLEDVEDVEPDKELLLRSESDHKQFAEPLFIEVGEPTEKQVKWF